MAYRIEDTSSSETNGSLDELALVQRAQRGDEAAFNILFERYAHQIARYLKHMVGNDGVSCDLTQDTFFRAWRGLAGLRKPQSFASWLYQIATNLARNYQEQARRMQYVPWEDCPEDSRELSTLGMERHIEERELTQIALAHVSPTYRACLILYVIEGLPQRKVAELLGMKESCVSKYLSRGKEEMRQIYQRLENEGLPFRQRGGKRK
ncbi:RNA polymerase sigma factor [Thermogemmatispora onikobensis]|uniref:RNA polymerase sigma factor n=1 Tax=Thermogemmatispora onikobensis TaxID=732234 RepID=UPI000853B98E|nr:RNA polymerase sigma factor [Thermogemmatispora onikobensis]